jgi:glycosyltransferase involved in cell wall biosynthesis
VLRTRFRNREEVVLRTLIAIPVYNERALVRGVIERVLAVCSEVLVVDDGSTDGTLSTLVDLPICFLRRTVNRGYGRSIRDAFRFARSERFDWVITLDADQQHDPEAIPEFLAAAETGRYDVISGSRYLRPALDGDRPPEDRRAINRIITGELNLRLSRCLGTILTDSFCGFKAYRVARLRELRLTLNGYAFPIQFWVQAAAHRLRVHEVPVRLIYNDLSRSFGGMLDDADRRLAYYRRVLAGELARCADRLPGCAQRDAIDRRCRPE